MADSGKGRTFGSKTKWTLTSANIIFALWAGWRLPLVRQGLLAGKWSQADNPVRLTAQARRLLTEP